MSITKSSPLELRASLRNHVMTALEIGEQISQLASKIEEYGTDLRFRGGISIADDALKSWLRNIEKEITAQYSEGTAAEASLQYVESINYPMRGIPGESSMYSTKRCLRIAWIHAKDEGNILESYGVLLDETLDDINFVAMAEEIKRQAQALAGEGYRKAADTLANFLGLQGYDSTNPSFKGNKLVFDWTFDHGCINGRMYGEKTLHEVAQAASKAEEDSGVAGLSHALRLIRRWVWEQDRHSPIASRTRLVGATVIEGIVFKGKVRFSLDKEVADAVLAFIAQFGSVDLSTINLAA